MAKPCADPEGIALSGVCKARDTRIIAVFRVHRSANPGTLANAAETAEIRRSKVSVLKEQDIPQEDILAIMRSYGTPEEEIQRYLHAKRYDPVPILPCRWREDANPFQRCYPLVDGPINKRRDDGLYEAAGALGKWLEEEAKPASPRPILQQSTPKPLPAQFPKVVPRSAPSPVFAQPAAVSCSPGSTILLVFAERDRPFAELLERHFRASKISVQYSGDVAAGSTRLDEYRKHVQQAKVILIIESADCYADSVCEEYLDLVRQYGNVVRVVKCRPLARGFSYQSVNNKPLSQVSDKEAMVQQIVQDVVDLF